MPIELTKFNAALDGTNVCLTWQTSVEINNSHFEIEESGDGLQFKSIGKVRGYGNTSGVQNYSYCHPSSAETSYYRLKQVDFDGAFEYSPIIHFKPVIQLSIFPNPFADRLTIFSEKSATLRIRDLSSKLILVKNLKKGSNSIGSTEIGSYSGILLLDISTGTSSQTFRVVKK